MAQAHAPAPVQQPLALDLLTPESSAGWIVVVLMDHGVSFTATGDQLQYHGPRALLTRRLSAIIEAKKPEIIAHLAWMAAERERHPPWPAEDKRVWTGGHPGACPVCGRGCWRLWRCDGTDDTTQWRCASCFGLERSS